MIDMLFTLGVVFVIIALLMLISQNKVKKEPTIKVSNEIVKTKIKGIQKIDGTNYQKNQITIGDVVSNDDTNVTDAVDDFVDNDVIFDFETESSEEIEIYDEPDYEGSEFIKILFDDEAQSNSKMKTDSFDQIISGFTNSFDADVLEREFLDADYQNVEEIEKNDPEMFIIDQVDIRTLIKVNENENYLNAYQIYKTFIKG